MSKWGNGYNGIEVYSTSELKTNKVWVDNKPIYKRVVPISNVYYDAAGNYKDFPGALNGDESNIVTLKIIGYRDGNYTYPSIENLSGYMLDNPKTTLRSTGWTAGHAMYINQIVLEYTKSTD